MTYFWTSWYSIQRPRAEFDYWVTGYTLEEPVRFTFCNMFEAERPEDVWEVVGRCFPDYQPRFIEDVEEPGLVESRFPGYDGPHRVVP